MIIPKIKMFGFQEGLKSLLPKHKERKYDDEKLGIAKRYEFREELENIKSGFFDGCRWEIEEVKE